MLFIEMFKRTKAFKHYHVLLTIALIFLITLVFLHFTLKEFVNRKSNTLENRTMIFEGTHDIQTLKEELSQFEYIEKIETETEDGSTNIILVLKKSLFIDKAQKDLEKLGYHIHFGNNSTKNEMAIYKRLQKIVFYMTLSTLIITIMMIISLTNSLLEEGYYNIAIMKTLGYKNHNILSIVTSQIIYLLKKAIILGIPFILVSNTLCYIIIFKNSFSFITLVLTILKSIIIGIGTLLITLCLFLIFKIFKIKKIETSILFNI